jgi:hypothetical protein
MRGLKRCYHEEDEHLNLYAPIAISNSALKDYKMGNKLRFILRDHIDMAVACLTMFINKRKIGETVEHRCECGRRWCVEAIETEDGTRLMVEYLHGKEEEEL